MGQKTYCPISGVVFEVKETSVGLDLNGRPLVFCCGACAKYFAENTEKVARARGL